MKGGLANEARVALVEACTITVTGLTLREVTGKYS
jgi:hypothetical protein